MDYIHTYMFIYVCKISAKAGYSPCKPRKTGFGEVQFGGRHAEMGDKRPRRGDAFRVQSTDSTGHPLPCCISYPQPGSAFSGLLQCSPRAPSC